MPFTPFHMGAASVVKVIAGRHFSMTVFGFSQVLMDVEPLVYLLHGGFVRHGFSHTLLGATIIGSVAVLAGKPFCQLLLDFWTPGPGHPFQNWLRGARNISWPVAIGSAFLGTYSHVVIDSMVSYDVLPFAPFTNWSPLLGHISKDAAHLVLLGMGVLGSIGLWMVYAVENSGQE
jgi:hypothetical protein